MNTSKYEGIVRHMLRGRVVPIHVAQGAWTDGKSVTIYDPAKRWPLLEAVEQEELVQRSVAHETGHLVLFEREARKIGRSTPFGSEEFYVRFADPLCREPGDKRVIRQIANVVEDQKVNAEAAAALNQLLGAGKGDALMRRTSEFLIWNRQGGRKCLREMEAAGEKVEAFIEAVFQRLIFGRLIEPYRSEDLATAAEDASRVISLFGKGAVGRQDAIRQVVEILERYCPRPWCLPDDYQPPTGEAVEQSEVGEVEPGREGNGAGQGEGQADGDGEGKGTGGGGDGRGDGTDGGDGGGGRHVHSNPASTSLDPDLEALLRMLERVIGARSRKPGSGKKRWRTWQPGDTLPTPQEKRRFVEGKLYGVDPVERWCVEQREAKSSLVAVFIDSSGSVDDYLFAQLYRVLSRLAHTLAHHPGTKLGVGQFSGGADWDLRPTDDQGEILALAEQEPYRRFDGATVVSEIYQILHDDFAEYESADLVVLTDGGTEDGAELAASLRRFVETTGCNLKLHFVVIRGQGTTREGQRAKRILRDLDLVRVWHIGGAGDTTEEVEFE